MNFEAIIEKYTVSILDHRIKTLIAILLLVLVATAGARFLEAPSGYRGFVESGQPNYQDILNLEEKYGMIIGQTAGDNRPKALLEFRVLSLSRIQRGKQSSALRIPKTTYTHD